MLDTVIIGGSSAGLSAALILGRSLRNVMVIDDGKPCNRFSHASHGFLTRDGVVPSELLRVAREQLERYSSIRFKAATAMRIEKTGGTFAVTSSDGMVARARTVLLATGLNDEMPAIEGIEGLWGERVFHCPYCDGYEVRGKKLVVHGADSNSLHQALLLRNLTPNVTLCAGWDLSATERERVEHAGIRIVEQPIVAIDGTSNPFMAVRLADGTMLSCDALFIRPQTTHRTPFARDLNCAIDARDVVQVDLRGRTSIAGVYAAGDIASPMRSVAVAVAQGASAAYGINSDLVEMDFP
ncbi:MAG: NAD(P)/FAD-dependent oxidoreductase [Anaerolineae bacterium]